MVQVYEMTNLLLLWETKGAFFYNRFDVEIRHGVI
jgi:hypothetical protein